MVLTEPNYLGMITLAYDLKARIKPVNLSIDINQNCMKVTHVRTIWLRVYPAR